MEGWIKLYRGIWDNPIVTKDAEHLALWIYLLTKCVWSETDVIFKGKRVTLKPGQFTTGRNMIAEDLGINRNKVDRILKTFESEHQIEQQMSNKCRLISVVSWDKYQQSEQQSEHQVSINRASSEHQVSTKEEYIKANNKKKSLLYRLKPSDEWLNTEVEYDL